MWWILGFRAAAAEVSSRGVVAEVVEGRGLLDRGEMGVGQLDRLDNEG